MLWHGDRKEEVKEAFKKQEPANLARRVASPMVI